jgi:hypothetical protein
MMVFCEFRTGSMADLVLQLCVGGDQGLYKKLMIKSDHEKNLLYGCECFRLERSLSIYPFVGSGSFRRPFDGMAAES